MPRPDEINRPNPAAKCGCSRNGKGNPIDTQSGNLYESLPGLSVPGRGPGLAFGLEFNSADVARNGAAGPGWSSVLDMKVTTEADGTKVVRQENGSGSYFAPSPSGWTAGTHVTATLTFDPESNTFEYTRQHFTKFRFDATNGLLKSISNLAGDTTTLSYANASQPTRATSMTDSANRSLTFTWNTAGDRLILVTDPLAAPVGPRTIKLQYSAAGDLEKYYDTSANKTLPGDAWEMTYDGTHRLTARQPPNQTALTQSIRTEFDSSGRAFKQTDQEGRILKMTYGSPAAGSTKTEYQSPAGVTLRTEVDSFVDGRREQSVVGYGTADAVTTSYGFDPMTRVLTSMAVNGKVTTYDPDPVTGNYRSITDPSGRKTEWTYNGFDQPLTQRTGLKVGAGGSVDAAEKIDTAWTYDAGGRLVATTSPVGVTGLEATVTYNRDAAHRDDVTSTVDGEGKTWAATYDPDTGDLWTATDPLSNTTKTTYNNIGWPETVTAPEGMATAGVAHDWETTYSYDVAARTTTTRLPTGEKTKTTLDTNGNTTSLETGLTDTVTTGDVTAYSYNNADQLTKVDPPGSGDKQYHYDDLGQQDNFKNELGANWATAFDNAGRIKSETDPLSRITSYRYNAAGQLASVEQPGTGASCTAATKKWCVSYSYDDAGRPTAVDYSEAGETDITSITYDALGRRKTAAKSDGHNEAWNWFETSMLKSQTDANGDTTSYVWDKNGQQTEITYPGSKTVKRTYDEAGRLKTVADWLPGTNTSTFDYDKNSNWKTTTFPTATGNVDNYTYDQSGRMATAAWTKTGPPVTTLGSELYGRPADEKGMVKTITPNTGPAKAFSYDDRDRLENAATAVYDDAGNLTRRADGDRQVFDPAQQLCWSSPTVTGTCGGTKPADATSYTYDVRGNRTSGASPSGGAATYGYDQANRLSSTTVEEISDGEGQYHEIAPKRILDTRGAGTGTCSPSPCSNPLTSGVPLSVTVGGGTIPATNVAAVAATITILDPNLAGYARVNSSGSSATATLNFDAHQVVNRFAIVPVIDGKIKLEMMDTGRNSDVSVDVTGYYSTPAGPTGSLYNPITPATRLVDTRAAHIGLCPTTACTTLGAGSSVTVQAAGRAGLPATGVRAAVIAVSIPAPTSTGYLRVAPGTTTGAAGTMNYRTGEAVNDVIVVPIDANGRFTLVSTGSLDVIIDVSGYFTIPAAGTSSGSTLSTLTPFRAADTRYSIGTCTPNCNTLTTNQQVKIKVRGVGGVPAQATTVVAFLIVTVPAGTGYLRVNPIGTGTGTGGAATINYDTSGQAMTVMAPIAADGTITVAANTTTDLIVDVSGYFAPPSSSYQYRYDSTGTRAAKSKDGGTETKFSWDTSSGLPLLTRQHDSTGADTYLIYGPGGQPIEQINDTTATYLHHDQLGSVRLATSTTGAVVATREWDAHGNPTVATGSTKPLLGYAGQYADSETGLQYLRARYYDPATGQFLSVDPLRGTTEDPYGYALSNPMNGSDPSGLCGFLGDGPCSVSGVTSDLSERGQDAVEVGREVATVVKEDPSSAGSSVAGYIYGESTGDCSIRGSRLECVGASSPVSGTPFTVGGVVLNPSSDPLTEAVWRHEMRHSDQWERFGPAFLPAWATAYGLWGECNPFEQSAGYDDGNYDQCNGKLGRGPLRFTFGSGGLADCGP